VDCGFKCKSWSYRISKVIYKEKPFGEGPGKGVAHTMYIHASKCKNDIIINILKSKLKKKPSWLGDR
jgi:hypothetical protein